MEASDIILGLLIFTIVAMAVAAFSYLRRRQLQPLDMLAWGLLTVFVPLLGPFLVIVCRPGRLRTRTASRRNATGTRSFAQVVSRLRDWTARQ